MDPDEKKDKKDDKEQPEESLNPIVEELSEKNLTQANPSLSERKSEALSSMRESPRKKRATSQSSETSFPQENLGSCNIPDPGTFTSFIQQLKHRDADDRPEWFSSAASTRSKFISSDSFRTSSSKAQEDSFRNLERERKTYVVPQPQELGLGEHNIRREQGIGRRVGISSTASSTVSPVASGLLEASTVAQSSGRISEPSASITQRESLIQQYQACSLTENTQQEQVLDIPVENSSRESSRDNFASSMLEASLRAAESGVSRLPGPFASFIQRHRDYDLTDEDSDEDPLEYRPVFQSERKVIEAHALKRDSRSGSLGAVSEESASRSTSEASHSSGHQENKEASTSESLQLDRRLHEELNPRDDEATDEDEGDLESEEHSQDSDIERKGYSL